MWRMGFIFKSRGEIIYLLLMSKPSRQHSKLSLGGQEKRKERKLRKSRSEEKMVGYSSASPQENGRQSPRVEPFNQGDRPPDAEENPGSPYNQRLGGQTRPGTRSKYINVKQE